MNHSPTTIPITFVHSILQGVRARGLAVDCFLDDADIAHELLDQASSRVTVDQFVALFESLVSRLDDDFLGLQSRPLRRGSFALIARSALGAPTLEVALRRIARTYKLLQDDIQIDIAYEGSLAGFALRFSNPTAAWPNFLHELLLRVFWQLLAWLVGGKLRIARFDFAFERPGYADSYSRVFPAPLLFDQRQSAFWFEATYLQHRVRQDEQSLFKFLSRAQANVILPQRKADTVSASVRCHLQQTVPLWPDMVATASSLHMSSATLQRRLASEGTSFQALKDALRRDIAIVRLHTSEVPLIALASELGFSDSASFQRAFKGWTGSAPGTYRQKFESDGGHPVRKPTQA